MTAISPFLKWAGGKRWLFNTHFIARLPEFNRYCEPFLGGGAGFFSLSPPRSVLSDVNEELINVYKVIRDHPEEIFRRLNQYQKEHSRENYYIFRSAVYSDKVERAAQLLYLNRTCWNGLYRLNKLGRFNVPIGTKNSVVLPGDNFVAVSKLLETAQIQSCDFEVTVNQCGIGDLLFIDPPYTVKHNTNGFIKYNEKIFSWADQVRLRNAIERAYSRGAKIILLNADHSSVRELYRGLGLQTTINRHSVISGSPSGRDNISELMVVA